MVIDCNPKDMDMYEDTKGTVYVKNCYYNQVESMDDFKYFIDKWTKTQRDPKYEKARKKLESKKGTFHLKI